MSAETDFRDIALRAVEAWRDRAVRAETDLALLATATVAGCEATDDWMNVATDGGVLPSLNVAWELALTALARLSEETK